jgi:hypothetical protein
MNEQEAPEAAQKCAQLGSTGLSQLPELLRIKRVLEAMEK